MPFLYKSPMIPQPTTPGLSIVVPVYNEAAGLAALHARLSDMALRLKEKRGLHCEVVYVDDGSRDATLAIARDLPATSLDVQVVSLSRNFGKEAALTAGLDHARGDVLIPIDIDLQDPPDLIGAFMARCVCNAHVKSGCAFGNRLANAPNAHQAQSGTCQLASQGKGPVDPIASAHKLVRLWNAACHRQHEAQRQIRHIVVENTRRMGDADAALLDGGDVDAVITHPKNGNHFHGRKQAEQFFVNFGLATTNDGPNPAQGPWIGDVLMVVNLEMVL